MQHTQALSMAPLAQGHADDLFDRIYDRFQAYKASHDFVILEGSHKGVRVYIRHNTQLIPGHSFQAAVQAFQASSAAASCRIQCPAIAHPCGGVRPDYRLLSLPDLTCPSTAHPCGGERPDYVMLSLPGLTCAGAHQTAPLTSRATGWT